MVARTVPPWPIRAPTASRARPDRPHADFTGTPTPLKAGSPVSGVHLRGSEKCFRSDWPMAKSVLARAY
jgi:hypothetical protein